MSSLADVTITLNIQNNVSYPVQMNVLGSPYNLLDTANAKTQYQYNVTSFTFTNETNLVIQYKAKGSSTFSTFTQQLQSQNIQGVINALNLLGIGTFQTYTQAGQTYISTYNDNFVFGQLNIYANNSLINPTFFSGTGFDAPITAMLTQADGKIVCCGSFTTYNGTATPGFVVRINTDGSIDTTFVVTTGFDIVPSSLAQQSDGKIVLVGAFSLYNGTSVSGIIRLNTNGSYDSSFVQGAGMGGIAINVVKIQADQKIVVAGGYNMSYDGNTGSLIRILSNGTIDGTFTLGQVGGTSFIPQIFDFVIQSDGKYVIVGDFNSFGGSGVVGLGIIRVNANGTYDSTLSTGTGITGGVPLSISIQADQKLLVGGSFTFYNAVLSNYAVRINTNGSKDTSAFSGITFDSSVTSILYLTSGKILVSGVFTTYNVTSANAIVRLNSNTTIDTSWNYGTGFGGTGQGILTTNSAETLYNIGGNFTSFNGVPANYIVQLNS